MNIQKHLFSFIVQIICTKGRSKDILIARFVQFNKRACIKFIIQLHDTLAALLHTFISITAKIFRFIY